MEERVKSLKKFKSYYLFDFKVDGINYSCRINFEMGKNICIKPDNVGTPIFIPFPESSVDLPSNALGLIIREFYFYWNKLTADELMEIYNNTPLNAFVISGDYL